MDEEESRKAAVKRLKEKRDFWGHVIAYILVNGLLVVIWWVTNDGGHFWPMWSLLGWGIGLVRAVRPSSHTTMNRPSCALYATLGYRSSAVAPESLMRNWTPTGGPE